MVSFETFLLLLMLRFISIFQLLLRNLLVQIEKHDRQNVYGRNRHNMKKNNN